MNIKQRIDYMIQCLLIAKEEVEKLNEYEKRFYDYSENSIKDSIRYIESHRKPNKAFIRDNLKNVGRECFRLSNEYLNVFCDSQTKTCADCQWNHMNGGTCMRKTMRICDQFVSYKWEKTDSSIDEI